MDKIYADTNVFLDALLDRSSKRGRDLGTPAMSIFSQVIHGRFRIIVSEWTLEELYRNIEEKKVKELLDRLGEQVILCEYTEKQKKKAKEHANHWQDYLHGIIAEEQGADCIVTRNVKDFRDLSGVKAKLPSQI